MQDVLIVGTDLKQLERVTGRLTRQKVMVGGATQKLIDEMQQAIRDAGLVPDQIVPGVIGPANAFETGHARGHS